MLIIALVASLAITITPGTGRALAFEFLLANGVEFTDKAPDNHGASTTGNSAPRENHAFWTKGAGLESPNAAAGTGVIRPLEASARAKGVRFLLN